MKREPVLTAATIAGILIALGSVFGVVIDADTATTIAAALLPIIAALFARAKVTPTDKL